MDDPRASGAGEAIPGEAPGSSLAALVRALRPWQWIKNLVCLSPLVFGLRLGDIELLLDVAWTMVGFCLVSSAGYLVNDLVDRVEDRRHPRKRRRPIASGRIRPKAAATAAAVLAAAGFSALWIRSGSADAWPWLLAYAGLTLGYTFVLRRIVGLDVAAIAGGFALRVLAGGAATGVLVSHWLLICTVGGAALVALGKRVSELAIPSGAAGREVLSSYRDAPLRLCLHALAVVVIAAYVAYTIAPRTAAAFDGYRLVWSAPIVAMAILRYLVLVRESHLAEDPALAFVKDPVMSVLAIGWCAVIGWVLRAAS